MQFKKRFLGREIDFIK